MEHKRSSSGIIGNVWFGLKTCFLASRFYFSVKIILTLMSTFIPLVSIYLWKIILNNLVSPARNNEQILICLCIYLLLKLVSFLQTDFENYINSSFSDEIQVYMDLSMMEKTSRMDLSFFDSAKMGDKVQRARATYSSMTSMTWVAFSIVSNMISVISTLIIVCAFRWWIGLITIIVLIPYFIYNRKYADYRLEVEKKQQRDIRKQGYFGGVFFDSGAQFELKLNNIGQYFKDKYNEVWNSLFRYNQKDNRRNTIINTVILISNIICEVLVIVVTAADVITQTCGVGDFEYNVGMVARLRSEAKSLIANVNKFINDNEKLNELQEFMKIKPVIERTGTKLPSECPKIEFCDVSFKYPGTDKYVLEHCSFVINPGEKIGLIGLNGAGKTTIVKLLFRFYDPESGCIKLDGVDLKEYDVYAVRSIFGVLFQDYVKYALPLREIIALSDFEKRFDDAKLKDACDVSGLTNVIMNWKDGFNSPLGTYYSDNCEHLSGGQWQLVGLARAYFKPSRFMVLDEPSAALDPISEDRIFEQLYHLGEGKSTITISHRLSNTTLADKILVIFDGHIIEEGSHSELLKINGEYAHLFRLQADRYV